MTLEAPLSEAAEMARSLDASLQRILDVAALLAAAEHDAPVGDGTQGDLVGLGWAGVAVGEEAGGLGLGPAARAKLAALAGRHLLPAAFRGEAHLLAPLLALRADVDARAADDLGALLAGELRGAGVALDARTETSAVRSSGDIELRGMTAWAALPPGARLVGLAGRDWGVVLDLAADPLEVEPIAGALELGQGMARVRVTGPIAAGRIVEGPAVEAIRAGSDLAVFAELFGAAQRTLELSARHAQERRQFGQAIVGFQAVSHRLAAMATDLEALESAVGTLCARLERGGDSAAIARVLRYSGPVAARRICESAIQIHGGMGFTWELGLHLYYRRILDLQYALGGADAALDELGSAYVAGRAARSDG